MQTTNKLINIHVLLDKIGHDLAHSLLFIHAMTGYDTTSMPCGIAKVSAREKSASLTEHAKRFMMPGKSHAEIEEAGQQSLGFIYS